MNHSKHLPTLTYKHKYLASYFLLPPLKKNLKTVDPPPHPLCQKNHKLPDSPHSYTVKLTVLQTQYLGQNKQRQWNGDMLRTKK